MIFFATFHSYNRVSEPPTRSQMIPEVSRRSLDVIYTILELFHGPLVGVGAQICSKNFYFAKIFDFFLVFLGFLGQYNNGFGRGR